MSSEHDESAEMLEELSMKSDAEKSGSPIPKKCQGVSGDHTKPRRRGRRGKRRKQRKLSGAAESENPEDSETHPETETACDSPAWDSDQELDCKTNAFSNVRIRPVNVPKAPENSTQFIIDDHNLCHLYMSFETPNPYLTADPPHSSEKDSIVLEPAGTDAAYIDIDFEYDPPQDFDNSAYYDREFEMSYKSNRFDDLLRLPRVELIKGLRMLEGKLKDLSDDLVKENPSPILEQLQAELLELQERHSVLKDSHTSLTTLVAQNEDSLASNKTVTLTLDMEVKRESDRELLEQSGRTEEKFLCAAQCMNSNKESPHRLPIEIVETSRVQKEVASDNELVAAGMSVDSKRSVLRDLPFRDLHDEKPHSVVSEEHELSAAVVV